MIEESLFKYILKISGQFFFQSIPAPGLELEFLMVLGSSFDEAFDQWGNALKKYHNKKDICDDSLTSNYLGILSCFVALLFLHC